MPVTKEMFKVDECYLWRGEVWLVQYCTICQRQEAVVPCDYKSPLMLVQVRTKESIPECMFRDRTYNYCELKSVPVEKIGEIFTNLLKEGDKNEDTAQ